MRSKYEIKAQKELEKYGWTVDNKAGMGRWAVNRDFFNLFDLVAIRKGAENVRWISIKGHNSNQRKHRNEIAKLPFPKGNIKELWRWPKNKKKKEWIKEVIT